MNLAYYPAKRLLGSPAIFIGSEENASDLDWLASNRIGLIVNCTRTALAPHKKLVKTVRLGVHDDPSEASNMLKNFERGVFEIEKAREQGHNVLVHCVAGISRSASMVAAYLMWKYNWTAAKSVNYIKRRKPETFSGASSTAKYRHLGVFGHSLKAWEERLKK